jgi:hypothetical protein
MFPVIRPRVWPQIRQNGSSHAQASQAHSNCGFKFELCLLFCRQVRCLRGHEDTLIPDIGFVTLKGFLLHGKPVGTPTSKASDGPWKSTTRPPQQTSQHTHTRTRTHTQLGRTRPVHIFDLGFGVSCSNQPSQKVLICMNTVFIRL